MIYPDIKTLTGGLALLAVISLPLTGSAQNRFSNGTGGGNWSDSATWVGGNIPTTGQSFQVEATDTVTADGLGLIQDHNQNVNVMGTLNVGAGTTMTFRRLNQDQVSSGTLNINGGTLRPETFNMASGSTVTVNLNSGLLEYRGSIALSGGVTFNISGGTMTTRSTSINNHSNSPTGAIINLTGGRLVLENGNTGLSALTAESYGSWNGGALYINPTVGSSSTTVATFAATPLVQRWGSNANNILGISTRDAAQTLNLDTNMAASQGILSFNIYSAASNDSDMLIAKSFDLGAGVQIQIEGVDLQGSLDDYIGATYQIFSAGNSDYSAIAATIVDGGGMTINGITYPDFWVDGSNLATAGTITIVPEPSTYALMFGGIAIGIAVIRRRRKA